MPDLVGSTKEWFSHDMACLSFHSMKFLMTTEIVRWYITCVHGIIYMSLGQASLFCQQPKISRPFFAGDSDGLRSLLGLLTILVLNLVGSET